MVDRNLRPLRFTFDDERQFDGFGDGSTWNGFDNVWVTPATREEIAKHLLSFSAEPTTDELEEAHELRSLETDEDGLICLGWCYATQAVR